MPKKKKSIYPLWVLIPALLIYTVFSVVPIVISLVCSFTDWNMGRLYTPAFNGIANYIELLKDPVFLRSIGNTFLFALATTILKTVVGFLLALVMVKKIPGRGIMRTIYYAPCVISITVVGVLFKSILANKGLLNNVLQIIGLSNLTHDWLGSYGTAIGSVILVETFFFLLQYLHIYGTFFSVICIFISLRIPFTVMTFCSFVKGVPREIDEASIMDGCNFWQMTIKILFPILKPIMVTNVVITAIDVWNNFMIPLFYLGSAKKSTISMVIYSFFGRYNRDWQYVFAALMLVVLPMLIFFIILQKHIIAGMTAGAVKG